MKIKPKCKKKNDNFPTCALNQNILLVLGGKFVD